MAGDGFEIIQRLIITAASGAAASALKTNRVVRMGQLRPDIPSGVREIAETIGAQRVRTAWRKPNSTKRKRQSGHHGQQPRPPEMGGLHPLALRQKHFCQQDTRSRAANKISRDNARRVATSIPI